MLLALCCALCHGQQHVCVVLVLYISYVLDLSERSTRLPVSQNVIQVEGRAQAALLWPGRCVCVCVCVLCACFALPVALVLRRQQPTDARCSSCDACGGSCSLQREAGCHQVRADVVRSHSCALAVNQLPACCREEGSQHTAGLHCSTGTASDSCRSRGFSQGQPGAVAGPAVRAGSSAGSVPAISWPVRGPGTSDTGRAAG